MLGDLPRKDQRAAGEFLQVRTAVLNNDLVGCFHRLDPGFTHPGGPAEIEVGLAA